MPEKPRADQTRQEYMRECVDNLKSEGRSPGKARDICFAVWMEYKGKGKDKK